MKKQALAYFSAALLALAACTSTPKSESNPVLTISGGQVQGVLTDSTNVMVYKGIPYAAPPVGDLRWKRPQPVLAWDGVKVADTFGNAAIQNGMDNGGGGGGLYPKEFYQDGLPPISEDCLYLNVYTPASAVGKAESKLPVAMWVHGGAYDHGWGYEITMDGDAWARRGVILVTINYRVGIFGFLAHPELSAEDQDHISGNYGTLDQIAALKWINENIAQFGGDPNNITVLGQSAGAASIKNLVSSPMSKGLVKRAIIQSGGGIDAAPQGKLFSAEQYNEQFEDMGKALMDEHGLTDLQLMRDATAEQVLDIFNANNTKGYSDRVSFRPHTDGVSLNEDFTIATLNNSIADVPYMIGYCANDIGHMQGGIENFCAARDSLSTQPAYMYLFARALPGDDNGAFHSSELWYTFHTLQRCWRPFTAADYKLADEMTDAWTNFAKYGNPNANGADGAWKPFSASERYTQVFNVAE